MIGRAWCITNSRESTRQLLESALEAARQPVQGLPSVSGGTSAGADCNTLDLPRSVSSFRAEEFTFTSAEASLSGHTAAEISATPIRWLLRQTDEGRFAKEDPSAVSATKSPG
jgi:hypothetical protein